MSSFTTQGTGSTALSVFTSPQGESEAASAYRSIMDVWATGYEELVVPTRFGDTHMIANGSQDDPPVVLLHALFATATSWYRNIPELSKGSRTYCVDVIGEANPSRPTTPLRSLADFLSWFTDVVDGIGIDEFAIVGNSYGAFTAAYYAMNLPRRARRLVLIGPAATISPMRPFTRRMFIPKAAYMFAPWAPGLERTMRGSVDWMHAGLPPDPLWAPLFYKTMVHGRLLNRVFPRIYTEDEISAIECPVLLMVGDHEVIYDDLDEAIDSARRLIPNLEVARVPDAHHITALAQPELANQLIGRFLSV